MKFGSWLLVEFNNFDRYFAMLTFGRTNLTIFFQLKSSSIDVYLNRTKETKIEIISTVPIACKQLGSTRLCNILIELYSFDHQFPKSPAHCNQSLLNQKPKPSACDFDFDGNKWRYYQSMPVSLLSDQTSRNSYRAIVQLRAVSGTDTLWGNVFLPEMKVLTPVLVDN